MSSSRVPVESWSRRSWAVTLVAVLAAALGPALPALATPARAAGNKDCTIVGTAGPDVLVGTRGADVICGRGGDDRLVGRGGADVLLGGPGNDVLVGGTGNDVLDGEDGDDVLRGQAGNDQLLALDGARARDVLDCGPGKADRASADTDDRVTGSCERVTQNHAPTDISMPQFRGAGIGSRLIAALQDEAAASDRVLSIHVELHNPAAELYARLGFRVVSELGVYRRMEWSPS